MTSEWRERLAEALDNDKRSARRVCLNAGLSPNFSFAVLNEGRDPSIGNLMALADQLDASISWLVDGDGIEPTSSAQPLAAAAAADTDLGGTVEMLKLWLQLNPDERNHVLQTIQAAVGDK